MKHDFFSKNILLDSDDPFFLTLDYFQAFNAFLLDDLARTETALRRIMSRKTRRLSGSHFFNYFFMFVDVVAGCALWEKQRKWRLRKLAKRATNELRGCVKKNLMNCDGILSLAEAEITRTANCKDTDVKQMFDTAISKLTRTGFLHFAGVANELCAKVMLQREDQYWADHYMTQAVERFQEWGAIVKVKQLQQNYQWRDLKKNMHGDPRVGMIRSSFIRGRVRYDSTVDSLAVDNNRDYPSFHKETTTSMVGSPLQSQQSLTSVTQSVTSERLER